MAARPPTRTSIRSGRDLNEAHGSVALHLTESGYNRSVSYLWGENPEPTNLKMSAWQWLNCYGDRPIMETLSSYIYANFFERFPNIHIASVENGAGWVPYLLPLMDKIRGMARNGWWMCGQLEDVRAKSSSVTSS